MFRSVLQRISEPGKYSLGKSQRMGGSEAVELPSFEGSESHYDSCAFMIRPLQKTTHSEYTDFFCGLLRPLDLMRHVVSTPQGDQPSVPCNNNHKV